MKSFMPIFCCFNFIVIVTAFTTCSYAQKRADAGRDTIVVRGNSMVIGGKGASDWCYSWQPFDKVKDPNMLNPSVRPDKKTTYVLSVTGPDLSFKETDEVDVYVLDSVTFRESSTQKFGYDDGNYMNGGAKVGTIWKSVEQGKIDPVNMDVVPSESAKWIHIISSNENIITVDPVIGSSSPQQLNVKGINIGKTSFEAKCGGKEGEKVRELNVAAYKPIKKRLAIRLVHEDNDDEQIIQRGQGMPNQVAITAGENGVINSKPGGDDIFVGTIITTGADGICQTNASLDDVQVIPLNQGKPNEIGIGSGKNKFRDTVIPFGDDIVVGEDITTGPDGICQSIALKYVTLSDDFDINSIRKYLNEVVFNQAVCEWEIVVLPPMTVNIDLDRDGTINVLEGDSEWEAIITNCKDDSFDNNIFFINNLWVSNFFNSQKVLGYMPFNQRYGFVDVGSHSGSATVENTVAHELGHGAFQLRHPTNSGCGAKDPSSNYDDNLNVMDYCDNSKLRKFQWDIINP